MYKIIFKKSAYKEYQKLPKQTQKKLDEALEMLAINPLGELLRFKKIRGKENWYRIRIGDYRIIYSPQNEVLVVTVIRVGHRKDIYNLME